MSIVPAELSDYIIDFLHKDARTLASCARVSRTWTPAARFHLFRTIVLQNERFTSAFTRLLSSSPELGHYVRELTVAKLVSSPDVFRAAKPLASPLAGALPRILAHLPHLRSLTLAHMELKNTNDLGALRHTRVTALTLSYCQFAEFADIVELVHSFPRLATLALAGLTWTEESRVPQVQAIPSLKQLVLGRESDATRLFEWFVAAGFHETVERLSARCASERDTDLVGPFLKLAGPGLRELELDWSFSGDKTIALPPTFTLAECTSLQRLHLQFPIHYSTRLPWVVDLLQTLSDASALRALAFEIRLVGGVDALDWGALAGVLTTSEACRTLEQFDVRVNLWPGVHRSLGEVEGIVREALRPIEERGLVRFGKISA
ncbi:hypothetical protein OH77DRAFT_404283 [Trametes cingulata]|nr:hypothetical protein OH77DRAFT_404283 [Trametes cingulata]